MQQLSWHLSISSEEILDYLYLIILPLAEQKCIIPFSLHCKGAERYCMIPMNIPHFWMGRAGWCNELSWSETLAMEPNVFPFLPSRFHLTKSS